MSAFVNFVNQEEIAGQRAERTMTKAMCDYCYAKIARDLVFIAQAVWREVGFLPIEKNADFAFPRMDERHADLKITDEQLWPLEPENMEEMADSINDRIRREFGETQGVRIEAAPGENNSINIGIRLPEGMQAIDRLYHKLNGA